MLEIVYMHNGCKDIRWFTTRDEFADWNARMNEMKAKFGDDYEIMSIKES